MSTDKPSRMAMVTEHEAAQVERPATGNERHEQNGSQTNRISARERRSYGACDR